MFPTEKKNKKALFNRIFSIAGLSIGGAILAGLIVYVARTMDVRALLASIQPLWLLGAALCVPLSESVDALIFYGMGRSAGCPVKLAGCFDAAYIGEFYYKLGPAGAPVQLKLMYDAGMSATYTASIYTWKAVANTMVYTGYAVAALAYELFWRREGLGPAVAGGLPTVAECGGFLYLNRLLSDGEGRDWPMAGALPGRAANTGKLGRFGYVTLTAKKDGLLGRAGTRLPAHEFHYWDSDAPGSDFRADKPQSSRGWDCAFHTPTLYAGFPHFHFWAAPAAARNFVAAARRYVQEAAL